MMGAEEVQKEAFNADFFLSKVPRGTAAKLANRRVEGSFWKCQPVRGGKRKNLFTFPSFLNSWLTRR